MTFSGFGKGGRRDLAASGGQGEGTYAHFFDPKVPAAERVYRAINALRRLLDIKAIESSEEELPPLPSVSARKLAGNYIVRGHELRPFQVVEVRGDDAKLHGCLGYRGSSKEPVTGL